MVKKKRRSLKELLKQRRGLFSPDELNFATSDFIFERRERYAPRIVGTLVRDLRSQLVRGIEAGDRVGDIKNRIRRVLVNEAPARIERIVRTEVNAAMNAGALGSYKASKLVSRKKWLTAGDALVRGNRPGDQFNHKQAHGQVVLVKAPFIVGGERLQHPGDPRASAANIIRCRCTTVPVLVGQRLPRAPVAVVPARLAPDAPGKPAAVRAPVAQGPGQPALPGFTEAVPSVPQSIAPGAPATAILTQSARETTMLTTPAVSKKRLGGGATISEKHVLKDGTIGVFKPKKGERNLRLTVQSGTFYQREAAAYDVAKVMGMDDLVPVTVIRKDNLTGDIGSFQEFVPGKEAHKLRDPYDGPKDLQRAAAYDYAIGQTDRHKGNWMIRSQGPKKGSFGLIDNGLAFPSSNDSRDSLYDKAILLKANDAGLEMPQKLVREWRDKWGDIEQALIKNGIDREAIDAMQERINTLAEMGSFPELFGADERLRIGRQAF